MGIYNQRLQKERKRDKYREKKPTYRRKRADIQNNKNIQNGNYIKKCVKTYVKNGYI